MLENRTACHSIYAATEYIPRHFTTDQVPYPCQTTRIDPARARGRDIIILCNPFLFALEAWWTSRFIARAGRLKAGSRGFSDPLLHYLRTEILDALFVRLAAGTKICL